MKQQLKCPNCNYTGQMYVCKACNSVFCNNCKKTVQGVVYKFENPTYQCPVCKALRKTEEVYVG